MPGQAMSQPGNNVEEVWLALGKCPYWYISILVKDKLLYNFTLKLYKLYHKLVYFFKHLHNIHLLISVLIATTRFYHCTYNVMI